MKKGRKLRILLYPRIALLIFGVLILCFIFILNISRKYLLDQGVSHLKETTVLIANYFRIFKIDPAGENHTEINNQINLLTENSATRITVILPDGKVVSDSEENPEIMENHKRRPEIAKAINGSAKSIVRFSNTLKIDMLYLASPYIGEDGEIEAVIRVATPFNQFRSIFSLIFFYLLAGSFFIVSFSILLIIYIDRRIERPLKTLSDLSLEYAELHFENLVEVNSPSIEIQGLSYSMRSMASQLKKQFSEIRAQADELQAVLDCMENSVIVLNDEGKVIKVNPSAIRLFKVRDESELLGKYYLQFLIDRDLFTSLEKLIREKELKIPYTSDPVTVNYDERSYHVYISVVRLVPQRTILLMFHDISEILHLENVRRDFVANVSHELKTPVTSIKGYAETLIYGDMKKDEEQYMKFLNVIYSQADRLHAIIEDLLTLSKLEHNKPEPEDFHELSLSPIIKSAAASCLDKPVFKNRKIEMDLGCDETVLGNPILLEQAFINIIDNGLKYSDPSTGMKINTACKDGKIIVRITDYGYGIPQEMLNRIFERFFRVDKGRSREKGGTGLGLSIVKHIILQHEGSVDVESKEGKGSVFVISLPVMKF